MSKPIASIGQRSTSQFIDDLAGIAVGIVSYIAAQSFGLPLELAIFGFVLYVFLCDGLPGGQSLGKRFTKTAVVHVTTEEPCRYWQSIVRNVAMILGVIDAVFILGRQRRRLGDYIASTKVVRLAEELLATVQQTDEEVETAWDGEIKRRIAEVEAGTVKLIPADEAFAEVRRLLK